jgi:PAS domain S-box-containing protein
VEHPPAPRQELLTQVLNQARELLDADFVAVALPRGEELLLHTYSGRINTGHAAATARLGSGWLGRLTKPTLTDPMRSPGPDDPDWLLLQSWGFHCATAVPLEFRGRPAGVFLAAWREPRDCPKADLRLARSAGSQVVLALEYTRLEERVSRGLEDQEKVRASRRRSEQRFRTLFDHSPEAVFLLDPHDCACPLRVVDCNEAAAKQNGYQRSELLGRSLASLSLDRTQNLDQCLEQMRREGVVRSTVKHRRKDGEIVYIERAASLIRFGPDELILGIDRDVTERRRLEEQLRQAQKMEAIGRLTGGVAHDFNNMLSVIGGYAELLLLDMPPQAPGRERIEEIQKAAQRAGDLTRQLLLFSRKETPRLEAVDLNHTIQDLTRMLGRLIGEDVELSTTFDPQLGRIRADSGQLQQVLVNLAVNARDAMPNGGCLRIETRAVDVGSNSALHPGIPPGPYSLLLVSDTGHGMDEATRERAFEPFFTTKPQGRGTGLGLAVTYEIVRQSGGFIHIFSEVGEGTVFRLYFPSIEERAAESASGADADARLRGSETLLIVEDEAMVRGMLRLTLQRLGYRVLVSERPEDALQLCADHPGPIHLLLTDLVMPQMNGRELAEKARALRPEMRVLLMSGYTDDVVVRAVGEHADQAFIEKPFQIGDLAEKLRAVLDREAPPPPAARFRGHVLVVDDDRDTRESLVEVLSHEGYHAEAVPDGLQALEQLRGGSRPDVILLDLRMPGMNGWVFRIEPWRRFPSSSSPGPRMLAPPRDSWTPLTSCRSPWSWKPCSGCSANTAHGKDEVRQFLIDRPPLVRADVGTPTRPVRHFVDAGAIGGFTQRQSDHRRERIQKSLFLGIPARQGFLLVVGVPRGFQVRLRRAQLAVALTCLATGPVELPRQAARQGAFARHRSWRTGHHQLQVIGQQLSRHPYGQAGCLQLLLLAVEVLPHPVPATQLIPFAGSTIAPLPGGSRRHRVVIVAHLVSSRSPYFHHQLCGLAGGASSFQTLEWPGRIPCWRISVRNFTLQGLREPVW